ncbi:MAG: R3H domain-containing nucleic acid-binding protein [Synechococcales bacterium]|nr:R3H domain-containing nucleic acid-binding protein [Synechococcales bacterium]
MGNHPSQERGQQWLENFLRLAGLPAPVSSQMQGADGDSSCWLTIAHQDLTPQQITALTGDHGQVLDSLQYLATSILNIGQSDEAQGAYTIELDGYRDRRQQALMKIAEEAVTAVRASGQDYEIKFLSSAERRQMHSLLQQYPDVDNFSRGQEPDRRLVVKLRQPETDTEAAPEDPS